MPTATTNIPPILIIGRCSRSQPNLHVRLGNELPAAYRLGDGFGRLFGVLGCEASLVAQSSRQLQRVESDAGHRYRLTFRVEPTLPS